MNKTIIYCHAVEQKKIKGKWVVIDDNPGDWSREISEEEYHKITSPETIAFFRSIYGTETFTRNSSGKIERLVSTSPSKQERTIYAFEFVDKVIGK